MWSGDIPNDKWGGDFDIYGDKEEVQKIMEAITSNPKITVQRVEMCMGTKKPPKEEGEMNAYVRLAEDDY